MSNPRPAAGGGLPEVEVISQPADEDARSAAAGPLASFAFRDLPLAPGDLSTAGSQLLSDPDEDYQREGPGSTSPSQSAAGARAPRSQPSPAVRAPAPPKGLLRAPSGDAA